MRLLVLPLAVLALAGCSGGPDASRAQDLLVQADAAQAKLSSVTYTGRTSFSVAGQRYAFGFGGGAVLKGRGAGDQWMQMRGEGVAGAGAMDFSIVRRGDRMTIRSLGQTQEVPVSAELRTDNDAWGAFASSSLADCVKKVDVAEGRNVNGEPATRIAGVVDSLCAFKAINRVASVGQATPDLDEVRGFPQRCEGDPVRLRALAPRHRRGDLARGRGAGSRDDLRGLLPAHERERAGPLPVAP